MKSFGYQKDSDDLLELKEVSIQTTLKELDKLIRFLQYVKEQHSKVIDHEYCHSHLRDWDKDWKKESSDFIIVTSYKDI